MYPLSRRQVLLALASLPFAARAAPMAARAELAALEEELHGELGLAAIDSAGGRTIAYRQDQRFPLCSTFKAVLAAAILTRAQGEPGLLDKRLPLPADRFVDYSPITGGHRGGEMSVAELCAAALQYSDNTAGNALLRELGGPAELTRYARQLGDRRFRLDRWETELNSAIPGDERDTTTPMAMALTLQKLMLRHGLPAARQDQLRNWMLGNTTGGARIRAAVPPGWQVADKTGTGAYGSANDIAVIYPPDKGPIVLAIYTRQPTKDADARSDIIMRAARIALDVLIQLMNSLPMKAMNPDASPWMDAAAGECGIRRFPVGQSNPRIVEYNACTNLRGYDDKISWCSSFVNWCLVQSGIAGTGSALARSWLAWGIPLESPVVGCIAVLSRDDPNSWKGHVGFFLRMEKDAVFLLGGNQLEEVRVHCYPAASVLSYRWPAPAMEVTD